jgi:general nucleoside transport system permease protein
VSVSEASGPPASVARMSRVAGFARGLGVSLLTTLIAFLIGGLVMAVTGADPIATYKAIWTGSGLQYPFVSGDDQALAAVNLQQTLIITTPLILTGLAVAFAFRAGLFNIGGNGQYIVGAILAVWVGSSFESMPKALHILLAILAACAGGAVWAGIAGFLKARTGAHEVISTIMLNWIAVWIGFWLFSLGGPLQTKRDQSLPISEDVVEGAKLPVFWGDPILQGLHIGIFIALLAVVVFWALLNRTTIGYEVRAVGFNPEAARYSGMNVGRNYVLVMAVCGAFAALGGALDLLGWQYRIATNDIQFLLTGFFGIAVALLGRNTAIGTVAAALLIGALLSGTSQRNLDPTIFEPSLASNLTYIIQGLVILIVSADVIVLTLLRRGRGLFGRRREPAVAGESEP